VRFKFLHLRENNYGLLAYILTGRGFPNIFGNYSLKFASSDITLWTTGVVPRNYATWRVAKCE